MGIGIEVDMVKTMKLILASCLLSAFAPLTVGIALTIPEKAKAESLWCEDYDDARVCVPGESIVQKGRQTFYVQYERFAFPDSDGATATVSYKAVDCVSGKRYSYKITGYTNNGQVVFEEKGGVAIAPPSPPGSRGADIANFVCGR